MRKVNLSEPAYPDGNTPGMPVLLALSATILAGMIKESTYVKGDTEKIAIEAAKELLKQVNEELK